MEETLHQKYFKVKVGDFEGPLHLLLELIEKRKLHISDVYLAQVADEFIEHIKSFEEFPMADSADFILIASTLLLIKSKSLLPNLSITEEEQASIEDLEDRLAQYKKYKNLSLEIQKIFGNFLYFPKESKQKMIIFSPTREINIDSLRSSIYDALNNIPKKEASLPKVVVQKIISLEEMIEQLSERIKVSLKTSFKEFSKQKNGGPVIEKAEKVNVIISFLAMLELVKQGLIRVNQDKHFDDIDIEGESIGTPTYY